MDLSPGLLASLLSRTFTLRQELSYALSGSQAASRSLKPGVFPFWLAARVISSSQLWSAGGLGQGKQACCAAACHLAFIPSLSLSRHWEEGVLEDLHLHLPVTPTAPLRIAQLCDTECSRQDGDCVV